MQGPSPLLVASSGQDWRPVQACSLEDLTVRPSNSCWLATEALTVDKWAVPILLECFLVVVTITITSLHGIKQLGSQVCVTEYIYIYYLNRHFKHFFAVLAQYCPTDSKLWSKPVYNLQTRDYEPLDELQAFSSQKQNHCYILLKDKKRKLEEARELYVMTCFNRYNCIK